ncbi:MAG: cytochrome C [Geobacteraceae bacterium]|nr:cytochrome C [Geobacteraceae bacterium]NTW81269.1 cytochrome C [Geobacteraceae bacterium]
MYKIGQNKSLSMSAGCIAGVVMLFLTLYAIQSEAKSSFSLKEGKSCATSDCHSNMGKDKFVHGPVATGNCTFCHKQDKKNVHEFKPITNVGEVCYACHDKLHLESVVHKPVKEGKCTGCHSPHQSGHKFQLLGGGQDLCIKCHKKTIISGKVKHGPVNDGECSACHSHHSSGFPNLLAEKGNDVCYSCHTDKKAEFASKKHIHAPMKTGCIKCHNPHSSDYKFTLIGENTKGVCFACHKDKHKEISEVKVKHGGLELPNGCLACHGPHTSAFPKQLAMAPMDLCLSCHDREYGKGDKKVSDMKGFLAKNKITHGPIKDKDCSGCHNTHGSKDFRILRGNLSPAFYAKYDPKNYELCFNCHNDTLVKDAKTTTLTGFRNGDQNLHFVHVNKTPKGRTCRACHDAHATNNPKHVRDTVPFGAWQLPVGLVKNQTGGSCLPGCHQEFKYDRNNKVNNR